MTDASNKNRSIGMSSGVSLRTARLVGLAGAVAVFALGACSSPGTGDDEAAVSASTQPATTRQSSVTAGTRVASLDFSVAVPPGASPSATVGMGDTAPTGPASAVASPTPSAAVSSFMQAVLDDDVDRAWSLLASADRERYGVPVRLGDHLRSLRWTSFVVASRADSQGSVDVDVRQSPRIDEIDGVIMDRSNVRVQTASENGGWKVLWTRNRVEQAYPLPSSESDAQISQTVRRWADARRACTAPAPNEYRNGLVGVVGLADALCRAAAPVETGEVADLDALDEPQPILDAFGGSALQWARVTELRAPVPMNVVVAPQGDEWVVVAIARPSLGSSAAPS